MERQTASPAPAERGLRQAARRARELVERAFVAEQWNIGVVPLPIESVLDATAWSAAGIDWMPSSSRRRMLADPFGLPTADGLTILAEALEFRVGRGTIASIEWPSGGVPTAPKSVIEVSAHLAYPYLFRHE